MQNLCYDVLVAGEINPDLILSGNVIPEFGQVEKVVDQAVLTIGSSSAIFACGVARLGLKVAFVGICGDDIFGRFMLEEMQKRNVDVSNIIVVPDGATGLGVILSTGVDRAMLTYIGLINALKASDISSSLLSKSRHLHVAAYFLQEALQPGLPALFARAQSLGLTTSLDTNYDPNERWEGFDELYPVTNIFLPNEKEAKAITHTKNLDQSAALLKNKIETVVIKLGEKGALALQKEMRLFADSICVNVVDTVGAGDSFDAGFLYGYLNHWQLEKSLRLACVCGALSTRASGGTAAQPTIEEALEYLK